jgi:hypothetical protein
MQGNNEFSTFFVLMRIFLRRRLDARDDEAGDLGGHDTLQLKFDADPSPTVEDIETLLRDHLSNSGEQHQDSGLVENESYYVFFLGGQRIMALPPVDNEAILTIEYDIQREHRELPEHVSSERLSDWISALACTPSHVMAATFDGSLYAIPFSSQRPRDGPAPLGAKRIRKFPVAITALEYVVDQERETVLVGLQSGRIVCLFTSPQSTDSWLERGMPESDIHFHPVSFLSSSSHSENSRMRTVTMGHEDGHLATWIFSLESSKPQWKRLSAAYINHQHPIKDVVTIDENNMIISDQKVHVDDHDSLQLSHQLHITAADHRVNSGSDSYPIYVATGHANGRVNLFVSSRSASLNVRKVGQFSHVSSPSPTWVSQIKFIPDDGNDVANNSGRLATIGHDGHLRIWRLSFCPPHQSPGLARPTLLQDADVGGKLLALAVAPDTSYVAVGGQDAIIHLFSLRPSPPVPIS